MQRGDKSAAPAPSISSSAKSVARCFHDASKIATPPAQDPDVGLTRVEIDDSFTLYKLWGGNLGVFQAPTDTRSLDYRLRHEPEIRRRVLELLSSLEKLLRSAGEPATDGQLESAEIKISAVENEAEAFLEQLLGLETSTECRTSWIEASISDAIRRLFKISALIEKSTASDRYLRAEQKADCRFPDAFDVAHVTQKHTIAPEWLTKRLGRAITKRRQFLKYADLHRSNLGALPRTTSELGENLTENKTVAGRSATFLDGSQVSSRETKPSIQNTKASELLKIDLNQVDDGFDDRSEFSVATSFRDGRSPDRLRVTKLDTIASKGEYFLCPYCHTTQKFNGQLSWEQHVYSDLRAYVCTFPKCGMRMFERRSQWIKHEMTEHRRFWTCRLCAKTTFSNDADLHNHLETSHGLLRDDDTQSVLIESGSCIAELIPVRECLLCDWSTTMISINPQAEDTEELAVPYRRFMKHMAGHLEELALFALPIPCIGESDDGVTSRNGTNSGAAAHGDRPSISSQSLSPWGSRASTPDIHAEEPQVLENNQQGMHGEPGPEHPPQSPRITQRPQAKKDLGMTDALSYFDTVMNRYPHNSNVYKKFFEILQTFRSGKGDIQSVTDEVRNLFAGDPDLIEGFSAFVPSMYRLPVHNRDRSPSLTSDQRDNILDLVSGDTFLSETVRNLPATSENRDDTLDLSSGDASASKRRQKHPAAYQCSLCPKSFTRAYNLRSHLRTHADERLFVCSVCGKAFARPDDCKRHESLHSGNELVDAQQQSAQQEQLSGNEFADAQQQFAQQKQQFVQQQQGFVQQRQHLIQRQQQLAAAAAYNPQFGVIGSPQQNMIEAPSDANSAVDPREKALLEKYTALWVMNHRSRLSSAGSGGRIIGGVGAARLAAGIRRYLLNNYNMCI